MSQMNGKICLVTGATNGIGYETALALARMGATVVGVGRSKAKADESVKTIIASTGNNKVEFLLADLSSMAAVRKLAAEFKAKYSRLDVLVNNAGSFNAKRLTTVDGFELTFGLNHLSYFLLTNLLLDVLKASSPARIVSVSSGAHQGGTLDFDDLQAEKRYAGFRTYSNSKLCNIVFTYELARRLEGTGVTANALHPGFVRTGFGRNNGGVIKVGLTLMQNLVALSPQQGADTSIYLASSPEVEGVTGKYFVKRKAVKSNDASYDQTAWTRLWTISEQLTGSVPAK